MFQISEAQSLFSEENHWASNKLKRKAKTNYNYN